MEIKKRRDPNVGARLLAFHKKSLWSCCSISGGSRISSGIGSISVRITGVGVRGVGISRIGIGISGGF